MNIGSIIFIILAACCAVWYVITTLFIFDKLRLWGQRVNFLWIRILAPYYASLYRQITKKETGRTGNLFYHWIISAILMLLFVVLAILAGFI